METINFLEREISQGDITAFAQTKVNLSKERADKYREKVNILRDHLERYISEHEDVGLVKMLLSGSLKKGTALRTINDIDVALYVKGNSAPRELGPLLQWLVERLRTTYHQIPPANIRIDGPCIVITYSEIGIDVDVAPVYYEGDPQWRGYLWDRQTGERILTSIPQHLEFIKRRKDKHSLYFAQTVRLLKWWARQRERDSQPLILRSFLIELLASKISDIGRNFSDYHEALEHFFQYVQKTGLKDRIAFADFYSLDKLPKNRIGIVEIFDPVNPENNVASHVTEQTRALFVQRADEALDALSYAKTCQTKGEAIECWQDIMGTTFDA
ncbi:MAG: hypothetical protein BGO12_13680 [Verrucomicrobia bacterium 61-8]|nr:MAG: hypothetical protein BGO12_13680 [Verrucomicrobia bacterium 61-8]